jgi:hypothetical protein
MSPLEENTVALFQFQIFKFPLHTFREGYCTSKLSVLSISCLGKCLNLYELLHVEQNISYVLPMQFLVCTDHVWGHYTHTLLYDSIYTTNNDIYMHPYVNIFKHVLDHHLTVRTAHPARARQVVDHELCGLCKISVCQRREVEMLSQCLNA